MKRILSIVLALCFLIPCVCSAESDDAWSDYIPFELLNSMPDTMGAAAKSENYYLASDKTIATMAFLIYTENMQLANPPIEPDTLYQAISSNNAWFGSTHVLRSTNELLCLTVYANNNFYLFYVNNFDYVDMGWMWYCSIIECGEHTNFDMNAILNSFYVEWYDVSSEEAIANINKLLEAMK